MANSRRFITCSRQPDRRLDHSGLRDRCDIGTQRSMRVILEPSRLMLYIRPFSPSTNTITGLLAVLESMVPPAPNSAITALPSTPTFQPSVARSEEHTSELQSLMRISYAVFCFKKKKKYIFQQPSTQ